MAAQIPSEVRRYLEELLTTAGVTSIPRAHEQMLQELFERLNSFTVTAYINSLSSKDREIFYRMIATFHPQDKLEQFLHDHVPNLQAVHIKALEEFRKKYLREISAARRH
jgi:hypothetical protein